MLRQFLVGGGVSLVTIAFHALVMTMVVHEIFDSAKQKPADREILFSEFIF
jgi:hypothetical protein